MLLRWLDTYAVPTHLQVGIGICKTGLPYESSGDMKHIYNQIIPFKTYSHWAIDLKGKADEICGKPFSLTVHMGVIYV